MPLDLDLTVNERELLLAIGRDGLTVRQAARRVMLTYGSARVCLSRIGKRNKVSRDGLLYWIGFQTAIALGVAFRSREIPQSETVELDGLKTQAEGETPRKETGVREVELDRLTQKGPSVEPARNYPVEVLD